MRSDEFRQIMSTFATGITVVTATTDEGHPYGITVNALASVSLDPLLILTCLDNRLEGIGVFRERRKLGVSILSEEQEDVSRYFARRGTDRSEASFFLGRTQVPLVEGALATLECEIVAAYPGGDHTIFVSEVKAGEIRPGAENRKPLLYFRSRYTRLHP